jgi:hypothetical protein
VIRKGDRKIDGGLQTTEGKPCWKEALEVLKSMKPGELPQFSYCKKLGEAALRHCNDMGPKGRLGHTGTDGSTPKSRIQSAARFFSTCGENIWFGDDLTRATGTSYPGLDPSLGDVIQNS